MTSSNSLIDPQLLFAKCGLRAGMHIADFGVGRTGHLVFPAAAVVGKSGVVYAVDILKDVLDTVGKRAALDAVNNLYPVWGDITKPSGVMISPKSLDVVFMVNVLHNCADQTAPLREAMRLMRDKARLVIADWAKPLSNVGPSAAQMLDFSKIITAAKDAGFVLQEDTRLGNYHRALILYRHD